MRRPDGWLHAAIRTSRGIAFMRRALRYTCAMIGPLAALVAGALVALPAPGNRSFGSRR